jgi:hypothetical protein
MNILIERKNDNASNKRISSLTNNLQINDYMIIYVFIFILRKRAMRIMAL